MHQKFRIIFIFFHTFPHNANIYKHISSLLVAFTGIQYCTSYQNHKVFCHIMISGENLPFCAADSNKYIGCLGPHVYGPPFFLHLILEISLSTESYSFNQQFISVILSLLPEFLHLWFLDREGCPQKYLHLPSLVCEQSSDQHSVTSMSMLVQRV